MTVTRNIAVLLLCSGLLIGCGGGGAELKSTSTTTTMGQELMDLDESYKKGIITEKEYKRAKEKILERYN